MEAYAGEVSPMMCFEADLQLVRASPADGKSGLSASRWALTEAAIIADISAALEEDLDSGDEFSVSADDGPDIICDERHTDDGPDTFDELHNRGQSSSTQLAVVETEAGPSGGPLATVDSSLVVYHRVTSQHADEHAAAAENSFGHFKCGCALATARGHTSCLDCFNKGQLRTIHQDTYGPPGARHTTHEILTHIHELYYALAVTQADDRPDALGRTHKIGHLKLLGTTVCAAAFRRAVGGTRSGHRDRRSLALRGLGPSCTSAKRLANVQLKAQQVMESRHRARSAFAQSWWADELALHDWLPNENAIRFKGPFWGTVHEKCYKPVAIAQSGHAPLSYKVWKALMLPGARQLASRLETSVDPEHIRVKRSARHSNFPECTECQRLRAAYLKVMSSPTASVDARDTALADLKSHLIAWQGDRQVALRLKDHSYGQGREWCYECDDKCGSHWVELPVAEDGRDNKSMAKLKYKFGLQCNIIAGGGGVNRFMVVPKHIKTGGNFGLTCLMLALIRAQELGRLTSTAGTRLYRHTDGGPDNLSVTTHLFHWLLVHIGIFEEVVWFRFDAGHSHTELADRFFSMLKRLFTSARGGERAGRLDGLLELEQELQKTFQKGAETAELEYIFANWDFGNWFLSGHLHAHHSFAGISFDNVFRYKYDESRWDHGCVKVTYKNRLSWSGDGNECEWSPFRQITTAEGPRNVTDDEGVRFVVYPPDLLRSEPEREDFKDTDISPASVVQRLVQKRNGHPEELSPNAKAHWAALQAIYGRALRPGALPEMPVIEAGFTFAGCPHLLLPALRRLRRFARPFIYWDPFADPPPEAWPSPEEVREQHRCNAPAGPAAGDLDALPGASAGPATSDVGAQGGSSSLRDPREHNHVTGAHRSAGTAAREEQELSSERWVADFPTLVPVHQISPGKLYLIQLTEPEAGYKLGFAEAGEAVNDTDHKALWFVKQGSATAWGDSPSFIPYEIEGARQSDPIVKEAFLLEVDDKWLTVTSKAAKHTHLRLQGWFARQLNLLAKTYPQKYGDANSGTGDATSGSTAPAAAQGAPPSASRKRPLDKRAQPESASNMWTPSEELQSFVRRLPVQANLCYVADGTHLEASLVTQMMALLDEGLSVWADRGTIRGKRAGITNAKSRTIMLTTGNTGNIALLAFVSFQLDSTEPQPAGYILELHVKPSVGETSFRRIGVGWNLLKEAERTLAAAVRVPTHVQFTLTVHRTNAAAKTLYRKAGYDYHASALGSQEIWTVQR
jgi:ribosomal protein S18 acetylase RimI-like enzyme